MRICKNYYEIVRPNKKTEFTWYTFDEYIYFVSVLILRTNKLSKLQEIIRLISWNYLNKQKELSNGKQDWESLNSKNQ